MERRFDDAEVRAILESAAERQEQADAAVEGGEVGRHGLSLVDLQEAGRAAGIDPAHIAAAADALGRGALVVREDRAPAAVTAPSGKPLLHESRLVPRVDDATWERIVQILRREAKVAGLTGQVGRVREWAAAADSKEKTPLTVRIVPDGERDRLEVTQGTEQLYLVPRILGGTIAGNGALIGLLMALPLAGGGPPIGLPLALGGMGAAIWGVGEAIARVVAKRRARELEAVADRIALHATDPAAHG